MILWWHWSISWCWTAYCISSYRMISLTLSKTSRIDPNRTSISKNFRCIWIFRFIIFLIVQITIDYLRTTFIINRFVILIDCIRIWSGQTTYCGSFCLFELNLPILPFIVLLIHKVIVFFHLTWQYFLLLENCWSWIFIWSFDLRRYLLYFWKIKLVLSVTFILKTLV